MNIKTAWRNLWRNKRRTVITVASISFGLLFAVVMSGIIDWWTKVSIDDAARMASGHVTIQHRGYMEQPGLTKTVKDIDHWAHKASQLTGVTTSVKRISGQLMLASGHETVGLTFMAIEPDQETKTTFTFDKYLKQGRWLKKGDENAIIIGKALAKKLSVRLGSKVVYTTTNKERDMVSGLARVKGIFASGSDQMDSYMCFMPLAQMQNTLGYQNDEATLLAVFVDEHSQIQTIKAELASLTKDNDAQVLTWQEAQPGIASMISTKGGGTKFMQVLIFVIIAAGILNTILMGVLERQREFGIMMALGMDGKKVFGLIMSETFLIALLGIAVGVMLTAPVYYYLATAGLDLSQVYGQQQINVSNMMMDLKMKIGLSLSSGLGIFFGIICISLLAGFYPAYKAARTKPLDAIHNRG